MRFFARVGKQFYKILRIDGPEWGLCIPIDRESLVLQDGPLKAPTFEKFGLKPEKRFDFSTQIGLFVFQKVWKYGGKWFNAKL